MRVLELDEVLRLHDELIARFGGLDGVHNVEVLKSAIAHPLQTFDGKELYPSIEEKAAILALLIIMGHPFIDGNKRTAHAALETFLVLNGYALRADPFDAEVFFVSLAAGQKTKDDLISWIREHIFQRPIE